MGKFKVGSNPVLHFNFGTKRAAMAQCTKSSIEVSLSSFRRFSLDVGLTAKLNERRGGISFGTHASPNASKPRLGVSSNIILL